MVNTNKAKLAGMVTRKRENVLSIEFDVFLVMIRVVTIKVGCSIWFNA